MTNTEFKISGMSCGHCVRAVRQALEGVPGVEVSAVAIGSAVVQHDPAVASVGAIVDALSDAGYEASEKT